MRFLRGPGVHLFTNALKRAHGIKWVFNQELFLDHAQELMAPDIADHSPPPSTDIMKVLKFASTAPTGIELQRLVLRHGDKFNIASG